MILYDWTTVHINHKSICCCTIEYSHNQKDPELTYNQSDKSTILQSYNQSDDFTNLILQMIDETIITE